ncbi:Gag-Pol polyprotein [Gossypium australe]|uniref:Gag-Pol polyprotein n=1 Tax=Gossypium australe TaxID=47621 RepID=A0A5B6VPI1_9ROSI|nr:Gag-Pol polyprotein [Gossypium australe]
MAHAVCPDETYCSTTSTPPNPQLIPIAPQELRSTTMKSSELLLTMILREPSFGLKIRFECLMSFRVHQLSV